MSNLKKEAQICLMFGFVFLIGLFFRYMYAGSKMGVGFVSYEEDPGYFTFWGIIWFGAVLASLLYMHKEAMKSQPNKMVYIIRVIIGMFLLVTAILTSKYF